MTVIVDNTSSGALKGEWGLCILVETGDKKILVDTGGSRLFARNLKALGFDISDIDYGILSHAHYDHANGMPKFFEENTKAKFYLREGTLENCYHRKPLFGKFFKFRFYIGLPRNVLSKYSRRIQFVSGDYKLCDGAYLIPHKSGDLSFIGQREDMFLRTENGWIPDNFSHEQSLVIETEKGLVIINSCSHGGAVNIINEIKSTFPEKHIYGLIGGLHLFNKSDDEVRYVAREIKNTGIDYVCTGHCTKERAFMIMKEELGGKLEQLHVGLRKEF
jgi:7,8-dihydropterin-6-yl-methyl-4-(beta-D-ribofuranosyl)aminobenzene 5'-phosphate synthase